MRLGIIFFIFALSFSALASIKAVTEEGEVVILKDDGTWLYEDGTSIERAPIITNPKTFSKGEESSFKLKSTKTDSIFWIEPKKWKFKKNNNGHDVAEYTFTVKGTDLYGMVISEQWEMDLEDLADLAINNAKEAAPDIKVVKQEYRIVNGHKVIYMEMEGTIQSIKFTYLGYYYSDKSGSTQYLTYTGTNLVKKYRKDIDDFLNGFDIQN